LTKAPKILPVMSDCPADIFCFQEAGEVKKALSQFSQLHNFSRVDAQANNNNLILSRFPVLQSGEITFPNYGKARFENCLWVDLKTGDKKIRIYNCHFGIIGVGPRQRAEQLEIVVKHALAANCPVIICGDLNTTIPNTGMKRTLTRIFHREPLTSMVIEDKAFDSDERYPFAALAEKWGFKEAADLSQSTWCVIPFGFAFEIFKLKLDWFLTHGLQVKTVSLGSYISDHRSILVSCRFE